MGVNTIPFVALVPGLSNHSIRVCSPKDYVSLGEKAHIL